MRDDRQGDRLAIQHPSTPGRTRSSWTWLSFVVHASLMLLAALTAGIPAEGDPTAWWYATPFVSAGVLAAAAWYARSLSTGVGVLLGGLCGSLGSLVVLFIIAGSTMSS